MRGAVALNVGRYEILQNVWFEVSQTDAGTRLVLCDERVDASYSMTVNEVGKVIDGGIRPISGKDDAAPFEPKKLSAAQWVQVIPSGLSINKLFAAAVADPFRSFPAYRKHRFTLLLNETDRHGYKAWPMAGYEGDGGTYIFYRRPSFRRGEGLLKVAKERLAILSDEADANRLPQDDWSRFFHLPAHDRFTLNGLEWKKLTLPQVAAAVAGKVFVGCHQSVEEEF